MGGEPYFYFVPYERDINQALQKLRAREFEAGRYNPVIPFLEFPLGLSSPAPGRKHRTIEAALEASDADGTRSILDIWKIGTTPNFGVAVPLSPERLKELFGTEKPTRMMIEENMDFFEEVERGHAIYIVVHKDGKPSEIFFAGYSYD